MESRNEADSRSDPTLPDVAPKPPTAEAGAKKSLNPCAQAARNLPPRLRASSRTSPARRDRCACARPPACPARAKGSPPSRAKHRRRVLWRPSAALPCIEPRTAVVDASPLRLRLRARARPRTCSRRRGPSLPGSGLGACSAPPPRSSHGNYSGSARTRVQHPSGPAAAGLGALGRPGRSPAGVRGSRGERGERRASDGLDQLANGVGPPAPLPRRRVRPASGVHVGEPRKALRARNIIT